jgi:hypothetical protein
MNHVGTAAPAVQSSEARPFYADREVVELRSAGQPRAAVPTWLVVAPGRAGPGNLILSFTIRAASPNDHYAARRDLLTWKKRFW